MPRAHLTLRDGARVSIRPIEPTDRQALVDAFHRLSPETRYRRFFGPVKELSPRVVDQLTQVDHADHEALVALDDAGAIVAVARYVRTAPGEAEPAVVVADDWQRRGLGGQLLAGLGRRAREEGIERFRAPVLARNRDAIELFKRMGETETTRTGREVQLDIRLAGDEDAERDLLELLRGVASGALAPARTFLARFWASGHGVPDRSSLRDTIVVATDGSPAAMGAVRMAAELAPALGVSVQVVAVHWPLVGDADDAEAALASAAAVLRDRGVEVHRHALRGDPATVVMDVADQERARMILLGPSTGGGASQLLLGSVGETVAAHAPCDVLIVR